MELRQNKNFLPVYKRSNAMWRETSEKRVVLYRLLVCFSCTNRLLSCKNEKALIFFAKLLCFYNIPIAWHFLKKYGKRAEICIEVFFFNKTHAVVSENCWNALLQQIWSFFESFSLCITCRNVCRIFCSSFCNIMRLNLSSTFEKGGIDSKGEFTGAVVFSVHAFLLSSFSSF